MVAVASRNAKDVARTRAALKASFVLVPGPVPATMKAYGVYNERSGVAIPATFVIDRTGVVRWRYIGRGDADRPSAATVVEQLRKIDGGPAN